MVVQPAPYIPLAPGAERTDPELAKCLKAVVGGNLRNAGGGPPSENMGWVHEENFRCLRWVSRLPHYMCRIERFQILGAAIVVSE